MSPMVMPEAVRKLIAMRQLARGWSLVVAFFIIVRVKIQDPYATEPISTLDSLLPLFLGVAIFGLLIAWRRERTGAILTIASMFVREIVSVTLGGKWTVSFLLFWLALLPPAILYLAASRLERQLAFN